MSRKYFGTDGIRGRVGEHPITADFVMKLGWAAGKVLAMRSQQRSGKPLFLVGKDTRVSGYMFESALQAGLIASGAEVGLLGPMPTPAIAYLTRTFKASAGIVISASHNPYYDNGIKFFSSEGRKLDDALEKEIEEHINDSIITEPSEHLGKAFRINDAAGRYIEYCKATLPRSISLAGKQIVLDCAHGATYQVAPKVFAELGAEIHSIGVAPDGLNINNECGATHTQELKRQVLERKADFGIAFDGDGDRVQFIDATGELVDGDELLYLIAKNRCKDSGLNGVVGTQMSNLGLEKAINELGLDFVRAKVGDRYVIEAMRKHDYPIGGESSGHIICGDISTTGDGVVAALQVVAALDAAGETLVEARSKLVRFPQKLLNVRVKNKRTSLNHPEVRDAVKKVESKLAENGRVLLRASGTEPVIRVMVEGEYDDLVAACADEIAQAVGNQV